MRCVVVCRGFVLKGNVLPLYESSVTFQIDGVFYVNYVPTLLKHMIDLFIKG